jgi:hypothetical protein
MKQQPKYSVFSWAPLIGFRFVLRLVAYDFSLKIISYGTISCAMKDSKLLYLHKVPLKTTDKKN